MEIIEAHGSRQFPELQWLLGKDRVVSYCHLHGFEYKIFLLKLTTIPKVESTVYPASAI